MCGKTLKVSCWALGGLLLRNISHASLDWDIQRLSGILDPQAVDPALFAWPVRNQAAQQEVSGGQASEASSTAPQCSLSLVLPPEPSPPWTLCRKIAFHKRVPGAKNIKDRWVKWSKNQWTFLLCSALQHHIPPPTWWESLLHKVAPSSHAWSSPRALLLKVVIQGPAASAFYGGFWGMWVSRSHPRPPESKPDF